MNGTMAGSVGVAWLNAARGCFKRDEVLEGMAKLAEAMRRRTLTGPEIARAGELAMNRIDKLPRDHVLDERILVLGQCTTTWLSQTISASALVDGPLPRVVDGAYDAVVPELMSAAVADLRPTTVVLVPWPRSTLWKREVSPTARVERELESWAPVWDLIRERHGARIVQIGYDWVHPGASGYHLSGRSDGPIGLVRAANEALRSRLPDGSYFVDLPAVSGDIGRRTFYDPRRYHWTKQPYSEEGTAVLGAHVWAGVRALRSGPKKVIAVDLDDTLWGGVVGELGPLGVALGESPDGEAFREFQRLLAELNDLGTLVCVVSKNNPSDARQPFESNANMILSLDRISAFEAHWQPKPGSIDRIAASLHLGRDSFVFVDDSPVEREQMRQMMPEVAVVEAGSEPAEYARRLVSELWFERVGLTGADAARTEQYRGEALREEVKTSFANVEQYLLSLEMRGLAKFVSEADTMRVVQLIGKTNQFNLTTRRHSQAQVEEMVARPGSICLSLSLTDRFGDYGLIGVLLAVPSEQSGQTARNIDIDTFLVSCRALGRTVEDFFVAELLSRARAAGYSCVTATYVPTAKNAQVRDLYKRFGFDLVGEEPDGTRRFSLALDGAALPTTYVRASSPSGS